eukprot:1159973-Pelagomonas_calceolata.AAC.5
MLEAACWRLEGTMMGNPLRVKKKVAVNRINTEKQQRCIFKANKKKKRVPSLYFLSAQALLNAFPLACCVAADVRRMQLLPFSSKGHPVLHPPAMPAPADCDAAAAIRCSCPLSAASLIFTSACPAFPCLPVLQIETVQLSSECAIKTLEAELAGTKSSLAGFEASFKADKASWGAELEGAKYEWCTKAPSSILWWILSICSSRQGQLGDSAERHQRLYLVPKRFQGCAMIAFLNMTAALERNLPSQRNALCIDQVTGSCFEWHGSYTGVPLLPLAKASLGSQLLPSHNNI